MRSGRCVYCGEVINPQRDCQLVTGWQRKAQHGSRRGGSDVLLREPVKPAKWACCWCIAKLRRGVPAGQGSLD